MINTEVLVELWNKNFTSQVGSQGWLELGRVGQNTSTVGDMFFHIRQQQEMRDQAFSALPFAHEK